MSRDAAGTRHQSGHPGIPRLYRSTLESEWYQVAGLLGLLGILVAVHHRQHARIWTGLCLIAAYDSLAAPQLPGALDPYRYHPFPVDRCLPLVPDRLNRGKILATNSSVSSALYVGWARGDRARSRASSRAWSVGGA